MAEPIENITQLRTPLFFAEKLSTLCAQPEQNIGRSAVLDLVRKLAGTDNLRTYINSILAVNTQTEMYRALPDYLGIDLDHKNPGAFNREGAREVELLILFIELPSRITSCENTGRQSLARIMLAQQASWIRSFKTYYKQEPYTTANLALALPHESEQQAWLAFIRTHPRIRRDLEPES